MKVSAQAKINLSLEIRGRRADGFHEIDTVMVPIALADEIEIERGGEGIDFTCSEAGLHGGENLVVRAARIFREENGIAEGLRIHLEKRIPHGAGLGGGSSDAAATLRALDAMFETRLGRERLMEMAGQLGSDVPFFVVESMARCRGRGEIVEPVSLEKLPPLLLMKPEFAVPTPWAYSRWQDARELPGVSYAAQEFPWGGLVNDLERPVFEKYLLLAEMKRWLLAQPEVEGALLSGSGSTMLALLRSDGAEVGERARKVFGQLWVWTGKARP